MSIGQIGQNSADEFFETMMYMTAYNEARTQISAFTKDIQSPVLKEAVESAMQVLVMGVVFNLIRTQEKWIEGIFHTAEGLVAILLASGFAQKLKSKFANLKGMKVFQKFGMFQSSFRDRVAVAQLVVDQGGNHLHGESTHSTSSEIMSNITAEKEHIVNKEALHSEVGTNMAKRYNETLLFKLFTKSFTPNDELVMKKILGRDTASTFSTDDLNKVADFLFVKDSAGNMTGLSEQFFQLINGLGYVHNKTAGATI
ncbi:MAG: hypothetical protein PHX13_12655 [Thiovulaceae bacterium]|nr:hypothetical protein [Sulfurimonadaceae bacterium]